MKISQDSKYMIEDKIHQAYIMGARIYSATMMMPLTPNNLAGKLIDRMLLNNKMLFFMFQLLSRSNEI
jgi:hypothetical protein